MCITLYRTNKCIPKLYNILWGNPMLYVITYKIT